MDSNRKSTVWKTICVFCGSSESVDKVFHQTASEFADVCCDNDIQVQYGGGAVGLMGTLAGRMLERGGKIKGIIPGFMHERKWAHRQVKNMVIVEDMRERKRQLIEYADAVVVLPGGIGTLEELMEVSSLKQLGLFDKPIFVINTRGYFNTFFQMLEEMVDKRFVDNQDLLIWQVVDSPIGLMEEMR